MNKQNLSHTCAVLVAAGLLSACAGGGYGNNNYGTYTTPQNNVVNPINPLDAMQSALINSLAQNMTASLLNGQIGTQIPAVDQSFRLQQLNNLVQSGAINQSQQWVNPQTGSAIAVNPIGQNTLHPVTQQQCQTLQETATLPNGQTISENRLACLNPQTGQWAFVQ